MSLETAKQELEQITKGLGMNNPSFDSRLMGGLDALYKVAGIEGRPDYTPAIGEKIRTSLNEMREEATAGSTNLVFTTISHEKEFNDFVRDGLKDNFGSQVAGKINQELSKKGIRAFQNPQGVAQVMANPDTLINALNEYDKEANISFNIKPETATEGNEAPETQTQETPPAVEATEPSSQEQEVAPSAEVDDFGNPLLETAPPAQDQGGINGMIIGALASLNGMEGFSGFGGIIAQLLEAFMPGMTGLTEKFNQEAYGKNNPDLTADQVNDVALKDTFKAAHDAVDLVGGALDFVPIGNVGNKVREFGHDAVDRFVNNANGVEGNDNTPEQKVELPRDPAVDAQTEATLNAPAGPVA